MAITRAAIQGALEAERSFVQKGGRVEVASADWDDGYLVLVVRSVKGQRRVVIDEALARLIHEPAALGRAGFDVSVAA